MRKEAALAVVARHRTGRQIVVTTMGLSMPWARISSSPWDFHSADGAMGHAADFALGLALARPERKVVCLNGDGSMLMCLETLVTAAQVPAPNYVLAVFANRTYEVTGNQPIPGAATVDFAGLARASGWRRCYDLRTEADLEKAWPEVLRGEGPTFANVEIEPGREPAPNRKRPLSQDCARIRTLLRFEDAPAEFPGFDPEAFAAEHRAELFQREG
jgi:thiamine pyrophosphate-dependent acetolactate synthase large subunit-like protein